MPGEDIVLQKAQRSGDISKQRVGFSCRLRFVQCWKSDHSEARKGFSENRYRHSAAWRMLWTSRSEVSKEVLEFLVEKYLRWRSSLAKHVRRANATTCKMYNTFVQLTCGHSFKRWQSEFHSFWEAIRWLRPYNWQWISRNYRFFALAGNMRASIDLHMHQSIDWSFSIRLSKWD